MVAPTRTNHSSITYRRTSVHLVLWWFLWVLTTGIGGSVHAFLYIYTPIRQWVVAPFIGLFIGIAQAGVLGIWGISGRWTYKERLKWVLASASGWCMAVVTFFLVALIPTIVLTMIHLHSTADMSLPVWDAIAFARWLVSALVSSAVYGFAQWWVLRQYVQGADWWLPITSLAWVISYLAGQAAYEAMPYEMIDYGGYSQALYAINPTVVSVVVTAVLFGIITACGMVWMLHTPRSSFINLLKTNINIRDRKI